MRTSPDYLAEVSDIARDSEAGIFPCETIDQQVALAAKTHGVALADVEDDVKAAVARHVANQPVSPRFIFTDAAGALHEIPTHDDDFFCVCIGGIQIGDSVKTPQAAQELVDGHLADGVGADDLTVEAYRQGANDDWPSGTTPFHKGGHWVAEYPRTA